MGGVVSKFHVEIDVNVVTKALDEWYSACRCPKPTVGGSEVVVGAVRACASPNASSSRRRGSSDHHYDRYSDARTKNCYFETPVSNTARPFRNKNWQSAEAKVSRSLPPHLVPSANLAV